MWYYFMALAYILWSNGFNICFHLLLHLDQFLYENLTYNQQTWYIPCLTGSQEMYYQFTYLSRFNDYVVFP